MKEIIVSVFLTIEGIAAASGLLFHDKQLHIISDNSDYLYQYQLKSETLQKTALLERSGQQELVTKKEKADFEAIAQDRKMLYIFGSGSGKKRNSLVKYDRKTKKKQTVDMSQSYASMQKKFGIEAEDFNIEGALIWENELWLFNRGNGPNQKNGIFVLDKKTLQANRFVEVVLPALKSVQTGFTDATRVGNSIYFIAAAEDSNSSYHDGQINGTLIGKLDPKTKKVLYTELLSETHKFEGIAFYNENKDGQTFLLCEDPDNEQALSTIYQVHLPK
ncbi:hypothetical protein PQ465_20875 [Sphingobacterium oryzagri]|uniref:Uncharacterized protein n=1 Tax=Sphingobacterium oryzagri TaxID=3025669 RepID=A0ABY7WGI8_9SPHI|nr:esterase-like activity of phytase family protein [Sphingobacterium sp. KACC 22765]WDF68736.1 hypothetical protein PQ465_20875 [Sphingobacterium sp. KACC 22765]